MKAAEAAAAAERAIQKKIDQDKARRTKKPEKVMGAMQAGARRYPEPPLPRQHIAKPGRCCDRAHSGRRRDGLGYLITRCQTYDNQALWQLCRDYCLL
jgi:hypothetical protein